MGEPNTAHRRVAALMAGWTVCDTRNLYAAAARVQSAKSGQVFAAFGHGDVDVGKLHDSGSLFFKVADGFLLVLRADEIEDSIHEFPKPVKPGKDDGTENPASPD